MLSIHVRPPQINDRLMPGQWEGDLIKGAGNACAVGVLVERTSRLVLLARMHDASAVWALELKFTPTNEVYAMAFSNPKCNTGLMNRG